jgi:hypothetical protein
MPQRSFQPHTLTVDVTPRAWPGPSRPEQKRFDYGQYVNDALKAFPNCSEIRVGIYCGETRCLLTVHLEDGQTHADIEAQRKAFFDSMSTHSALPLMTMVEENGAKAERFFLGIKSMRDRDSYIELRQQA